MAAVSLPESNPPRVSLVESTSSDLAAFIIAGPAFSDDPTSSGENWLPSERKLALRFGVSRPVIREAMKRLEFQGLVEISHGRNTKVSCQLQRPLSRSLELQIPDDFERLRQLNETRLMIEPDLAKLAALRADDADIEALESCHKNLSNSKSDLAAAAKFDARFHELIARAAGNDILALILSSLGDLGEATRRRTLSTTGIDRAIRHHRKILDAIRDQDEKKAARMMRHHVKQASEDLEESSSAIKSSE